jgi:hypothetical protein
MNVWTGQFANATQTLLVSSTYSTHLSSCLKKLQEVVMGQISYAEYRHDNGMYRALDKKKPPARPVQFAGGTEREVQMWTLLLRCWDHDPAARPSYAK